MVLTDGDSLIDDLIIQPDGKLTVRGVPLDVHVAALSCGWLQAVGRADGDKIFTINMLIEELPERLRPAIHSLIPQ